MSVLYSTATFIFERFSDITSKNTLVSDAFSSEFPEISTLNTPEDAPVEIPRFVLFSHHGFSTVIITSNMIQLSTKFDNNFSEDWIGRCKPYLEKKVNLVFNFFKELNINPKYCGLTVNSLLTVDNSSVAKIENLFLKKKFRRKIKKKNIFVKEIEIFEFDTILMLDFWFWNEVFEVLKLKNMQFQL